MICEPIARARAAADGDQRGSAFVPAAGQRVEAVARRRRRRLRARPASGRVRSCRLAEADEGAADRGVVVRRALAARGRAGTATRRWPGRRVAERARRGRPASAPSTPASQSSDARRRQRSRPSGARCPAPHGRRRGRRRAGFGAEAVGGDEEHARGAERDEGRCPARPRRRRRPTRRCRRRRRRPPRAPDMPQRAARSARSVPGRGRCLRTAAASATASRPVSGQQLVRPVARRRRRATACRRSPTCRSPCRRSAAAGHSPWAAAPSATLAKISGSCAATQSSFGAVKPGIAMLPVIARKRGSRVELGGFLGRAAVVPQDAGAQHLVGGVEQRRAVHLAGEADALDRGHLLRRARRRARRARPRQAVHQLVRVLLRPAGVRPRDLERRALRLATIRCASSIRTAFTDDVPISMPRYMASAPRLPQPILRNELFRAVPRPSST